MKTEGAGNGRPLFAPRSNGYRDARSGSTCSTSLPTMSLCAGEERDPAALSDAMVCARSGTVSGLILLQADGDCL